MPEQKKRQHYIPRFLLNRFSSRSSGKKFWIWQFCKERPHIEISTRDVAVGTKFYGDSQVEDALAQLETRVAKVLRAIDSGEALDKYSEELRWLVYMLSVRTRSLREHIAKASTHFMDEFSKSITTDFMQHALQKEIDKSFEQHIESALSELPIEQRYAALVILQDPKVKEAIKNQIQSPKIVAQGAEYMRIIFGSPKYRKLMFEALKKGHSKGLLNLLKESNVPKHFNPKRWEIVHQSRSAYILGDICVIARTSDDSYGSLLRFGSDWSQVLLPISPTTLLIGSKDDEPFVLSASRTNQLSAELSHSYIYANIVFPEFHALVDLISKSDALVTDEEIDQLPNELWDELT